MGCRPRPALKKIRQLMFISLIITILSLGLLVWTRPFQNSKIRYVTSYQRAVIQMCSAKPKDSFVAVNLTKTVLLSAYLEHRFYSRKVRVIAVALRSERVDYRCVFYCQKMMHFSAGASSIHSDHFGFPYGTADIMCPVPSGCRTPSHVAVVSAADKSEGKRCFRFLEVKNQVKRKTSFDFNFVVCFSTMFDFTNVLQLVQSLEMLQLLGVNRVIIYKTSCSPETQRVLDYYTKTGLVEVIPWSFSRFLNVSRGWLPEHGPGDLHYFGQIPALNDCIYRYMYQTRHMALHDVDELILPQSVSSWLELLPYLEMKHGRDMCYKFENNVFPYNIILPPPANQTPLQRDHWENITGVNILDHLYREPLNSEDMLYNFKVIVNPRTVFTTSVHDVLRSEKNCVWVDRNTARMYHTRAQKQPDLTPDQLVYDDRLLSYSARLSPAVSAALRRSGLLPDDSSN